MPLRQIELRGVRVHNLKNIDLDIPLGRLVVISGVSGSGKSSLAFDTLYAEGQRRYIESFSIAARQHLERIDRPDADRIAHVPPAIAIRTDRGRRKQHDGRSTVATLGDLLDGVRLLFVRVGRIQCPTCHTEVRSQSATDVVRFVARLPAGTRCQIGFAVVTELGAENPAAIWLARGYSRAIWGERTVDLGTKPNWPTTEEAWIVVDRIVAGKSSPERIAESADVAMREGSGRCWILFDTDDPSIADHKPVDGRRWSEIQFHRDLTCLTCGRTFLPVEPRLLNHMSFGACLTCRGTGRNSKNNSDRSTCIACGGTRYREEARAVEVGGHSIADLCSQTTAQVSAFVRELNVSLATNQKNVTELIRSDLEQRFRAVCELGLDYLTLDRSAETLSGGESRRLMLAAVIGSRITGSLVVVDEPSSGLATNELPQIVEALRKVKRLRNSVIAVEHSPLVMAAADHVIELGPNAGPTGGYVIYQGVPAARALTSSTPGNSVPKHKAMAIGSTQQIRLTNVWHHNLRNVSVEFNLGQLNLVAGPSGSGKTSLVTQVLVPAVCRKLGLPTPSEVSDIGKCELSGGEGLVDVVLVDQSPLTKSARSNPATWLEVFDEIRQTFAATLDARQRGFTSQHFSFNSPNGGRCRSCQGTGLLKQDMQFLPDVTLVCPECGGTRYRREILDVKYRGRSIADVLAMSVSDAASFFRSQPRVQIRFQLLKQIGLDYLVLGQPSETLSGGEAQRLKLGNRLALPNRGPCLIVCDEPTDGLHPNDIDRLITCFRELVANGHTLVLADNSPELIGTADSVIKLD